MAQVLSAQYAVWTPGGPRHHAAGLLRALEFDWDTASAQLAPPFDEDHTELRGVSPLADGGQSIGVLRAALHRNNVQEGALVLSDDWCAAGLCRARPRFVLLRPGQADAALPETQVIPRIRDSDLLGLTRPGCLKGVTLGVQSLPSRYDAALTAMATVLPQVRVSCERAGTELGLVAHPLRLT